MFSRRPLDLSSLRPTSKITLKLSCLAAAGNDIKTASELYDFIAGDLDLPDTDPAKPTAIMQIKQGADDALGWISQHKDDITQGIQLVQGLMHRGTTTASTAGIPPIPKP